MCSLLAADLIISSDSKYHAYRTRSAQIFNRYIKKKKSVFLQHGVTALKRVDSIYGKGNRSACDLFIVTNTMEEKIILDNFGYEPAEIANTGFARWDVLKDCSQENHNILIMPTWRKTGSIQFQMKHLKTVPTSETICSFLTPNISVKF